MQASRIISRNLAPSYGVRGRKRLRVVNVPANAPLFAAHNPSLDSDQLAYRLCELSLQKIQKEARASEPDLRHVLACTSMQRLAQQDLLHRLATLQTSLGIQGIPLLPGCDELPIPEEDEMDMRSLEIAVNELETASRRGEIARVICFQQISDM
ncbi:uncharacterized protein N7459_001835 [Penicillium hispanicum]|uniref:uncharacterized protein n=1 Tax=Penicillium hispanicum TaxID=1080232 RepID=UPI0025413E61|nr:uncharacterized protein N7459_001835 [Penicillium hispanicum]KAJ5591466.1 hypothetical protein N7459_001835 [Penicillium hispanicum]